MMQLSLLLALSPFATAKTPPVPLAAPAECEGKFPKLEAEYDIQIAGLRWNFTGDGNITSWSTPATLRSLGALTELSQTDDNGPIKVVQIEFPDGSEENFSCGFDASDPSKSEFQCNHEGLKYIVEFNIVDFVPNECTVDTFEFVGVRGTMNEDPADPNLDGCVLELVDVTNEALAGTGSRVDRLLLQRPGAAPWKKGWWHWMRKQRGSYYGSYRPAESCTIPTFPQRPVRGNGLVEWISCRDTFDTSGSWDIRQYDANAMLNPKGQFLRMEAALFRADGAQLPREQTFCVIRPWAPTALCNNARLTVFGSLSWGALGKGCEPRELQYFGQYRYSLLLCYGPSVFATQAFQAANPTCSGGFPKFRQRYVCNLTAVNPTVESLVTQDMFELQNQGTGFGPAEGGRLASLLPITGEETECFFEDADTVSCIFGETCLIVKTSKLTTDANCNLLSFNFLGASGGWCSPEQPDVVGNLAPRFYSPPPTAYTWLGNCAVEEDLAQFEFVMCRCAFGLNFELPERPCGLPFLTQQRFADLGYEDCRSYGLDETCCNARVLGAYSFYSFRYPLQSDCDEYQTFKGRVANGTACS